MKTVPVEFQHTLVLADVDKKKIRKVLRMTSIEGSKMMKKDEIRK